MTSNKQTVLGHHCWRAQAAYAPMLCINTTHAFVFSFSPSPYNTGLITDYCIKTKQSIVPVTSIQNTLVLTGHKQKLLESGQGLTGCKIIEVLKRI
jgi:hypothetical protein